jgi:hypothetical protein
MRILHDNQTVGFGRAVFGTENGGDGGKEIGADQLVCLRLLTGPRSLIRHGSAPSSLCGQRCATRAHAQPAAAR